MNKLFKFLLLISQIVIIALLLTIIRYFNISIKIGSPNINILKSILNNNYFIGISCSVFAVLFLYFLQIKYCKHKIKKDLRFSEAMTDVFDMVKLSKDLLGKLSTDTKDYIKFYNDNKSTTDLINKLLVNKNNSIIFDSIQTVFFININFKLLEIINNIKNRQITIKDYIDEINQYNLDCENFDVKYLNITIKYYYLDLSFLMKYYDELFKYFNFNLDFTKLLIDNINCDPLNLIKMDSKERKRIFDKAYFKASISYLKKLFLKQK